jgi:hypothetical protein
MQARDEENPEDRIRHHLRSGLRAWLQRPAMAVAAPARCRLHGVRVRLHGVRRRLLQRLGAQRKKLVKETKDEEKAVVERKVVWVCRGCDGGPSVGCTGGSGAGAGKAGWWPTWLCWPYAKP